jgi:hypothetical protein
VFKSTATNAASFTDDTSLPYASCRVSIHAQILRDDQHELGWYFYLRALAPDAGDEFKRQAIETFFTLPALNRAQIFKTLRSVRIHVTDPRPYVADLGDFLRRILPAGVPVSAFLRRLDDSTRHLSRLRDITTDFVATRVLHDSPAQRLLVMYRAWEYSTLRRLPPWFIATEDCSGVLAEDAHALSFDLDTFRHKNASILNDVANSVSASASVFTPAIDKFSDISDDPLMAAPMAGPWFMTSALNQSHAFGEGNSRSIDWIENQRSTVLAQADRAGEFYPEFMPEPLVEIRSAESLPIQAADIAAGIARELWRRSSLVHLVAHFEYVTYNGRRLSEDEAAWCQKILDQYP